MVRLSSQGYEQSGRTPYLMAKLEGVDRDKGGALSFTVLGICQQSDFFSFRKYEEVFCSLKEIRVAMKKHN